MQAQVARMSSIQPSLSLVPDSASFYHRLLTTSLTLSRNTLNNDLDHALLSLPHQLKRLLGLLKLEAVRDEPLDIDLSTGDQVYGGRVAANGIPDRTANVQVTDTGGSYGKDDVLSVSVRAFSQVGQYQLINSPHVPYRLAHRCRPSWSSGSRSGCMPRLQSLPGQRRGLHPD